MSLNWILSSYPATDKKSTIFFTSLLQNLFGFVSFMTVFHSDSEYIPHYYYCYYYYYYYCYCY